MMKRAKIWVNTTDFPSPLGFSKHCLKRFSVHVEEICKSILRGEGKRDLKRGKVFTLHSNWQNVILHVF